MASPGYHALCYHYVRTPEEEARLPRILGTSEAMFRKQVATLASRYAIMTPDDVRKGSFPAGRTGLLFTFDDGLADHVRAGRILAEEGIRALFFIPTCIFEDDEPASPIVIHYGLAASGIERFIEEVDRAAADLSLPPSGLSFIRGRDNPWEAIAKVKRHFKYDLDYRASRRVLLEVYRRLFPDRTPRFHLTREEARELVSLGHSLGVHTRSHVSVGAHALEDDFSREIVEPKAFLEKEFGAEVFAFSYPFGEPQDCLSTRSLIEKTDAYEIAFTVEEKLNTGATPRLELGRYQPMSYDTETTLLAKLDRIAFRR